MNVFSLHRQSKQMGFYVGLGVSSSIPTWRERARENISTVVGFLTTVALREINMPRDHRLQALDSEERSPDINCLCFGIFLLHEIPTGDRHATTGKILVQRGVWFVDVERERERSPRLQTFKNMRKKTNDHCFCVETGTSPDLIPSSCVATRSMQSSFL
jgi:hypothetical protein